MLRGGETILLGKVVATHGIKGQLRVASYSGELENIIALGSVILKGPSGEMETFEVAASAIHGKKVLVSLKNYNDINRVLHLVGRELYARREQLPELSEGEYYWCELLGLRVVTTLGETLGELTEIIPTGSNDVYVVKSGGKEYLLPALEDVILDVDLNDGIMTVGPPEGLLDL
jgi:16S rRNA processing protein RimM